MRLSENVKSFFKELSPFYIILIAISPILISLLIHIMILSYASLVRWTWFDENNVAEEEIAVTVMAAGKKNDGLKFQGTDQLDSFDADDNLFDPVPEIEYRPVLPEVEILPDPKASDELDIISVEAAVMDNKWVNPATGGQPLDTGSEMLVGSFSRHIQILREGGLDVVFVFDSTASMSGYLKKVKLKIKNLASAFRKLVPTCRIGLVTYRDKPDEYVTKCYPLTYGILSLNEFLSEDAPPHKEDMPQTVKMIRKFREKMGGKLSVLDIRRPKKMTKYYWTTVILPNMKDPGIESFSYLTDGQAVMADFQTFAEVGGGESARLINEEKVIKHMLLLIFGTRWEMYLNEFMKTL
ncbi:MAG: VWA domain-containing protein [Deltaproteobacteria bacterium]|nr:VWA domain-containing protein [Deltaproteobacteria bacterium]